MKLSICFNQPQDRLWFLLPWGNRPSYVVSVVLWYTFKYPVSVNFYVEYKKKRILSVNVNITAQHHYFVTRFNWIHLGCMQQQVVPINL